MAFESEMPKLEPCPIDCMRNSHPVAPILDGKIGRSRSCCFFFQAEETSQTSLGLWLAQVNDYSLIAGSAHAHEHESFGSPLELLASRLAHGGDLEPVSMFNPHLLKTAYVFNYNFPFIAKKMQLINVCLH